MDSSGSEKEKFSFLVNIIIIIISIIINIIIMTMSVCEHECVIVFLNQQYTEIEKLHQIGQIYQLKTRNRQHAYR